MSTVTPPVVTGSSTAVAAAGEPQDLCKLPSLKSCDDLDKEPESDAADEDNDEEIDDVGSIGGKMGSMDNFQSGGSSAISRTVTLQMLLAAKMLEPGKSTMTIEYLGQKFVGDLLADGKIKSQETETIFCSPSAWAMHCKRIINPEKKSGCGWASVRYKGKKLDSYKAQWLREKSQSQKESNASDGLADDDGNGPKRAKKELSPEPLIKRSVLPHNTVSNRNIIHDTNTLVETVSFAALNRIQPFLVSITTSSVLLMDFHCHLTKTEVCGYLGGSWDVNSHTLAITHAFPCRNSKHDRLEAGDVELEIQRTMLKHNLMLVGWYHSHPKCAAQPTLRDCDAQLEYQIKMRGASEATYSPCVGLVCAPYNLDNPTLESNIMCFWVVPPPENRIMEYGRPMLMSYSVNQDAELSPEVISEMDSCIDYYKRFPFDMVDFLADFTEDTTYIEKLKITLYSKFPRKQDDHQFWNWLRDRLGLEKEAEFTPPKWPATLRKDNKDDELQQQLQLAAAAAQQQQQQQQQHQQLQQLQQQQQQLQQNTSGGGVTMLLSENGSHLDLSNKQHDNNSKISKEDKLMIRSLQEQLSLPSGLNMNPSPISSTLLLPTTNAANSMSSNNSVQTTSSSPRDSPITIPSNSASPAKFEVPIRASPSPAKSDTSSTKTRNSPAPSPNKYTSSANNNSGGGGGGSSDHRNDRMDRYDRDRVSISSVGSGHHHQQQQQQQQQQQHLHHDSMPPRNSSNLSSSASSSGGHQQQQHKYDFSGTTISAVPSASTPTTTAALIQQQQQQAAVVAAAAAAQQQAAVHQQQQQQQQHQQAAAAAVAQQQAVAAQQQAQQISDYYSAANYASLAKNLSGFSPSDYAMLFQSKDYGLSSLNQLASAAGMSALTGVGGGGGNNNSSGGGSSNSRSNNNDNNKSSSGSNTSTTQSSQSVAAAATAAAMAGNMKDFLAQLEKSTELSYLMQSQYNYPQMSTGGGSNSKSDYSSSSSTGGGGGSKSKKQSNRQQQQSQQQQQQRQLEEEYKKDANKINEFIRSQEYANLLMEQAEALSASGYGSIMSAAVAGGVDPSPPPPLPPPTKKSSKKSSSSLQSHHNSSSSSSSAAAAAAAAASVADLTSLLQASPKIHELNSLFQSGKTSDLHALLQQQFSGLPSSLTSSVAAAAAAVASGSSSSGGGGSHQQSKKQSQQQQQQQHQQQLLQQQQQQLQDYSALFAHSKMSDLQSLMAAGGLSGQSSSHSSSSHHGGGAPSAADLSALFSSALGGSGGGGGGVGGGKSSADVAALSASVDMLGSLLQGGGGGVGGNKSSDLSSLLFSQANAAELNNLFAQSAAAAAAAAATSSSSSKHQQSTANNAAAAYYTQAAIDKAQQDMAALYQQHNKYAAAAAVAAIPDPLSKSTLAANNMFMNPSAIYANMKMQQEAINAMIMKPPKVSSSSSTTSSSKSREASASPAAMDKKIGGGGSTNNSRDSPASLNNMKYNFSAADLAISSVPSSAATSSALMGISDLTGGSSNNRKQSPALLDMSMAAATDASAANSQLESRLKKRMEFSSIADLVAAPQPPPSKMQKLEELANLHQSSSGHDSDGGMALNLSND